MNQRKWQRLTCLLFFLYSTVILANPAMKMELALDKTSYRVGEPIKMKLTFSNMSQDTIHFLPTTEIFPADLFVFRLEKSGVRAPSRHFVDLNIDFATRSKAVVNLPPGQTYQREVTTALTKSLPKVFGETKRGLFVNFTGSAIELPILGRYLVVATYRCSSDEPVRAFMTSGSTLWTGYLTSSAIPVTFTGR